jgi:hypothetical protein
MEDNLTIQEQFEREMDWRERLKMLNENPELANPYNLEREMDWKVLSRMADINPKLKQLTIKTMEDNSKQEPSQASKVKIFKYYLEESYNRLEFANMNLNSINTKITHLLTTNLIIILITILGLSKLKPYMPLTIVILPLLASSLILLYLYKTTDIPSNTVNIKDFSEMTKDTIATERDEIGTIEEIIEHNYFMLKGDNNTTGIHNLIEKRSKVFSISLICTSISIILLILFLLILFFIHSLYPYIIIS